MREHSKEPPHRLQPSSSSGEPCHRQCVTAAHLSGVKSLPLAQEAAYNICPDVEQSTPGIDLLVDGERAVDPDVDDAQNEHDDDVDEFQGFGELLK